jgi:hypothetical protein
MNYRIIFQTLTVVGLLVLRAHADVFTAVPETATENYQVLYELPITTHDAIWTGATPVPYSVNNSATVPAFDRIAYYLELTNGAGTQWVYASMDAFTDNAAQLGLPHSTSNPVVHQREVTNMNVLSNVAGVTTGTFLDSGRIEMWPSNYNGEDAVGAFAASAASDWGDGGATTAAGYGSFQVHNAYNRQVLLAFNHWGASGTDDLGIGNRSGSSDVDWTRAANSADYTAKKLVILVRPQTSRVAFTQLPKNRQLYPRDTATNQAVVPITGTESFGSFDKVVLKVSRNGVQQSEQSQALAYTLGAAPFSFAPAITAELAEYEFEVMLEKAGQRTLVQRVTNVVAGDVLLFYGQSNAEAILQNGSANTNYASPWVRTFGQNADSGAVTRNILCWSQAEGDGGGRTLRDPGAIGQWALVLGRKLVDTQSVPVAILNGSRGGYTMPKLQRDDGNPDNLDDTGSTTRTYNRLRYRALQAGVAAKARAMFFCQGEADGGNTAQHVAGFTALHQDWQTDFPGIEHLYVTQLHAGCGVARESVELRDAQRLFGDVYDDLTVMSSNALGGHDGCHYAFATGYQQLGLNHLPLVRRDLYGVPAGANTEAPNPQGARFLDTARTRIELTLRQPDDTITFPDGALTDFVLTGTAAKILSHSINGNKITLQLDASANAGTTLKYLAHDGSGGSWVTNANGIGLLTFSEPVSPPPGPTVSLTAPSSSREANVGDNISIAATAAAGDSGAVTKIILLANGVPQFETNSATLNANWTVPVAGAHRLIARAYDEQGYYTEAAVTILAGPHTSPGGVANGMLTWLKAESGVIRDVNGFVTSWRDQSGNNNHAAQATAANQPKYIENLFGIGAGVRFDGGDFLASSSGMSTGSYTKVVRFFISNTTPSNNLLSATVGNGSHALVFGVGSLNLKIYHGSTFATANTAAALAQTAVAIATYDATTNRGEIYMNGTSVGGGDATADNSNSGYQLGAHVGGNFLNGSISEALIYNRVLSATERGTLFSYLDDKYRTPFQRWQKAFITGGQENAPTADPDGDGLNNAQEYAFGTNPLVNALAHMQPEITNDGTTLTVTYRRAANRPDVGVHLEGSTDLITWQRVTDVSGSVSNGIESRIHSAPGTGAARFFHVVVSMP